MTYAIISFPITDYILPMMFQRSNETMNNFVWNIELKGFHPKSEIGLEMTDKRTAK